MIRTSLAIATALVVADAQLPNGLAFVPSTAGLAPGAPGTVTHGSLTMLASEVPDDAPPHFPWRSKEDFFRYSGLSYDDMTPSGIQNCASTAPGTTVYNISDGENERCFVAIKSPSIKTPAPVMFFAHGSGGDAGRCGNNTDRTGMSWPHLADEYNFIYICGEAVQQDAVNNITGQLLTGGIWAMPEVFNDTSGRHCTDEELENKYMSAIWEKLGSMPDEFDISKSFITGCSEGSAFSHWQAVCRFLDAPANYTAFETHSTGLKIKGDGNILPPCVSDPSTTWGECPTCKYWPTVVGHFDGLKACIFDNTEDPHEEDPFFYRTSVQMAEHYKAASNRYETYFKEGGHCEQHSFDAIAKCLDDGTGRLISQSRKGH